MKQCVFVVDRLSRLWKVYEVGLASIHTLDTKCFVSVITYVCVDGAV